MKKYYVIFLIIFLPQFSWSQDSNIGAEFTLQFRIVQLDTNWQSIEKLNDDYISNLNGGDYTVEVRLLNERDGKIVQTFYIPIHVPKFFWERISFWWLHIVVFLILFWLIRRYEIKRRFIAKNALLERQRAVELERTRIARDFHDGAGSALAQCSISLEVALEKIKNGETKQAITDINLALETLKNISELLRDIIWSLDPSSSSFEDMIAFFRNYAVRFLKSKDLNLVVNTKTQYRNTKFTSEFRRNIFFILKEVCANICKHSNASRVDIYVELDSNQFFMSINDNGVGLDVANIDKASKDGKGLNNIKSRAIGLGGKLNIISQKDKGTKIEIIVPDIMMHKI